MQQYSDPPGGKLQIVDQSDSRLVISVPAGGKKARGIGCFAVLWLAITIPLSLVFFMVDDADWEGGEAPPTIFLILFFSLFYAVGFGMLYGWIRMRFMEVLIAIEPGRLTIQRTLLGRKKLKRCDLTEESCAQLVESYSSNDVPVYTVKINTADGDEKFATALSRDEKQWIADTINRFLGHETSAGAGLSEDGWPTICDECGGELLTGEKKRVCSLCGKVFTEGDLERLAVGRSKLDVDDEGEGTARITSVPDDVVPYELPPDSRVTVERDEPGCLQFSYRVRLPVVFKVAAGGFLGLFCAFWYGGITTAVYMILTDENMGNERWFILAFVSIFLFAGLMPLGALLAMICGRVRVIVNDANLTASIGVGPLRKKKLMACSLIRNVGTGPVGTSTSSGLGGAKMSILQGVIVRSSDFTLPLTVSSDEQFNNEVAGLVRYQLNQMGYLQQDD